MENRQKRIPLFLVILLDIILAALMVLVIFASTFSIKKPKQSEPNITAVLKKIEAGIKAEEREIEQYQKEIDMLSPWQKEFKDKFSEQLISTENSYKSPNISIDIETLESNGTVYHLADIYIANIDNFKTYTANGEFKYFSTQNAVDMANDANAILAISGDFYSYQSAGLLVRNSYVYMDDEAYCDICVMYKDGSIETLMRGEYDKEELLAKEPLQIWNFGPALLDSEGKAKDYYNMSRAVSYKNPRSALGYYEPGHYCFLVADGRQEGYSVGFDMYELARVFEDLGCTCAYNLDGGGSAVMLFNGEKFSRQSNSGDRELGDILIICESEETK